MFGVDIGQNFSGTGAFVEFFCPGGGFSGILLALRFDLFSG